jgi:hypothetical protein
VTGDTDIFNVGDKRSETEEAAERARKIWYSSQWEQTQTLECTLESACPFHLTLKWVSRTNPTTSTGFLGERRRSGRRSTAALPSPLDMRADELMLRTLRQLLAMGYTTPNSNTRLIPGQGHRISAKRSSEASGIASEEQLLGSSLLAHALLTSVRNISL